MVARIGIFRPSCNAGEFGELLDPRYDIKEYYSACRRMRGAEPIPQSGFRRMPGSLQIGRDRNQMTVVDGTRSIAAGPFASFPAFVETTSFDATNINAVAIGDVDFDENITGTFHVEVLVNFQWQMLGASFTIKPEKNNRVASLPPGQSVNATSARLVINASGSTAVTNASFSIYAESSNLPEEIVFKDYNISKEEAFHLSYTPQWCDVWKGNSHVGAYKTAFNAEQLKIMQIYAESNTIGSFHAGVRSQRALRIGENDHEWRVDDWPYQEIGDANYGTRIDGTPYVKTDDQWTIFFRWTEASLIDLNLIVNAEETGSISIANTGNWAAHASVIQDALLELPSLHEGIVVSDGGVGSGFREILVTFGGENSGEEYEFAAQVVNTSNVSSLVSHTQVGKTEGEPVISNDRGWVGVVSQAQDRLVYAGLKTRKAGLLFSETGEYFNLNTDQKGDDSPFVRAIRVDSQEVIRRVLYSKYLVVLTDQGEYFANDRELSRNKPLNFISASKNGCSATVDPQDVQGLLYYSNEDGNVLYMAGYDDVQTSYVSTPASTFAGHLFQGVVRSALKKPDDQTSAHRMLYLRSDGLLLQFMVMQDQNINSFTAWETEGQVKAVAVDRQQRVYLSVEREDANGSYLSHEVWDRDVILHGQIDAGATDTDGRLTLDARFEGQAIWVVADGFSLGSFVVENNAIDLEFYYADCKIGFWTPLVVEPMPFVKVLDNDRIVRRPGRIHTFRGKLKNTSSIAIGANGEEPRDIPLSKAGDDLTKPPCWNGIREVTGLSGFMVDTSLVITQTKPGELEVRDIVVEAKL